MSVLSDAAVGWSLVEDAQALDDSTSDLVTRASRLPLAVDMVLAALDNDAQGLKVLGD